MSKQYTGIDIGSGCLKLATCKDGVVERMVVADMPENLVRDGVIVSTLTMSQYLRETARAGKIKCNACAVSLPSAVSFFRRTTVPAMTAEQLKVNLPYEFRDFISGDMSKYFFDYAVNSVERDESGEPVRFDLMIAATQKSIIADYSEMLRRAGFKMKLAMPEGFAFSNLIRDYEKRAKLEGGHEYCVIDVGHSATRLYIYTGSRFETSRVVDMGGFQLAQVIADANNVDAHLARVYMTTNHNDVLTQETSKNVYTAAALELMRAVNFYRYNNPKSELRDAYLCGGGVNVAPLVETLATTLDLSLHSIKELMPADSGSIDKLAECAVAIGVTM